MTEEEGKEMAKKNGLEFMECSAKNNINIEPIFHKAADKVYKKIENNEIDLTNEVHSFV